MKKLYFTPEEKHEARKRHAAVRREKNRQHFRDKAKAYRLRMAQQEPERQRELRRKNTLKERYDITPEEVHGMWLRQEKCCLLCGLSVALYGKGMAIDHCHTTGRVRGILCDPCNRWLGKFEKRGTAGVERARAYLGWEAK